MAGPYHIDTERLVFKPDNLTQVLPVTPTFFQDLDKNFDDFKDHMLVTRFAWDEAWPTWEIHPNGDELVFLLSGDTDFVHIPHRPNHLCSHQDPCVRNDQQFHAYC